MLVLSELEFGDIGLATGEASLVGTMGFYATVVPEPGVVAAITMAAPLVFGSRARRPTH